MSGPLAVIGVVLVWASLLVVGFALVYWPSMPAGFVLGSGLDPDRRSDLLDAVYLSMVSLATLGFGDIVPMDGWLRLVVPLQAFAGFALFTAAVSWALQVHPVLARRRAVALRLTVIERSGGADEVAGLDSTVAADLLHQLAVDLAHVRMDLHQYGETYYFRESEQAASLPARLPFTLRLAHAAGQSERADVRFAARLLRETVDDLAALVAERFLRTDGDTTLVLDAYATAHGGR